MKPAMRRLISNQFNGASKHPTVAAQRAHRSDRKGLLVASGWFALALLTAVESVQGQTAPPQGGLALEKSSDVRPTGAAEQATGNVVPPNAAGVTSNRSFLEAKLVSIIVPEIDFRGTTFSDAVEFLRQEARRLDPDPDTNKRGVNLFVQMVPGVRSGRITIHRRNVPLGEILRGLAELAGLTMQIDPFAVSLTPPETEHPTGMGDGPEPGASGAPADDPLVVAMQRKLANIVLPLIEFRSTTASNGIEFLRQEAHRLNPEPDMDKRGVNIVVLGRSSEWNSRVTLTLDNLPLSEALRYLAIQAKMKVVVDPYAVVFIGATNKAYPSASADLPSVNPDDPLVAATQRKLASIVLRGVEFRSASVREAVEFLRQLAEQLDPAPAPDRRGVNLVFNQSTGAPSKRRLSLTLDNIPLRDALRYLAMQADLKIEVEASGVNLTPLAE